MAKLTVINLDSSPPTKPPPPSPAAPKPPKPPAPKITPQKPAVTAQKTAAASPRAPARKAALKTIPAAPSRPLKTKELPKRRLFLKITSVAVLGVAGFYGWQLLHLKDFAAQSRSQVVAQLAEAKAALANLNPNEAAQPLTHINDELIALQNEASKYGILQLASWWDTLRDTVNGLPGVLQDLTGISGTAIHLNEDISFLKEHTLGLMLKQQGQELLDRLAQLQDKLGRLSIYVEHALTSEDALDRNARLMLTEFGRDLSSSAQAVAALRTFLNPPTERHVLVMFQNDTELRPAGGFLGSYADITIKHAGVSKIEVRDIYDPDGQLNVKIMPPAPLQRLTQDWEARDANWFFDFPTSARKVIGFLNQSQIYVDRNVIFEGALAINTKVLGDLINIVGPVDIPQYDITITGETFLRELQREVEIGEDKKVNQPKRILQILAPIMIERFSNRTPEQDAQLLEKIRYHFSRRNVMLYLDNPVLQQQFSKLGVSGEVSVAPKADKNTIYDYLAVVSANMAGGKSDAVTRQHMQLTASFDDMGTLIKNLTVRRTHTGAHEPEWWYRADNKTYTQIYMPLGSKIYEATGMRDWPTPIKRDYSDYTADAEVLAMEKTRRFLEEEQLERFIAFEKTVFAGWLTTPAGESSQFTMRYRHPKKFSGEDGAIYELTFERQSGSNTTLSISIAAPDGFIWKETGNDQLVYASDDPPGKLALRGTLVRP